MANTWLNIKKELIKQSYIVDDTWLQGCVDYSISENPNATQAEIIAFVIYQWQLSDLREINNGIGCLPKNLSQQKLVTLPGTYLLQIDKGYDISTSKYKQLEKIRKVSTENNEVNEASDNKNNWWEPKSKRMMNLFLTDGIQDVTAIEYQPVKFLKDLIIPGLKIMIKGPIVCRRGVLLLNDKNCCEIGGEVEGLLITNATENVLARALNLQENPDPYKNVAESESQNANNDEVKFDDFMDVDLDELDKIENLHTNKKQNTSINNRSITSMTPVKKRESIMLNSLPVCFESIPEDNKNEMDDTDDELIQMIDEDNLSLMGQNELNEQSNDKQLTNNEGQNIDDFNFDSNDFPIDLEMEELENASNAIEQKAVYSSKINDVNHKFNRRSSYEPLDVSKNVKPKNSVASTIVTNKVPEITTKSVNPINSNAAFNSDKRVSNTLNTSVNRKTPVSVSSSPTETTPKSSRKTNSKFDAKNNQKITAFMKRTDTPEKTSPAHVEKNYDSIHDVIKMMPVDKVIIKKVRGTVKSMKKLERKDQNWYLEGSVSDGSGTLDVFFSSEILERIVGLSVAEFSKRKKLIKTDPSVEQELRTALRKAEATISKLNGLLQLELTPSQSKAKIISVP